MIQIPICASRNYDILIAPGIRAEIGERVKALFPKAQNIAVVTDDTVGAIYLDSVSDTLRRAGFTMFAHSVPPGEGSKSGARYLELLDCLAENRLTRSDVILALGGGVVGDLTGFAAASYLRGVPYIQMPTSLLAMVDSSVGGKTAIDLPAGKNLAGAFYQPALVLCDTDTLQTLKPHYFCDGMAEVIKYGMLGNADLLAGLQNGCMDTDLESIIAQCVRMKQAVVQEDEFDTGQRMLLNLGHTIGHAIERLSGFEITHGFAVAIGMAIDTRAAVRRGLCPPDVLTVLEDLLTKFKLPNLTNYSAKELFDAALHDKKRTGDTITIITPVALGKSILIKIALPELLGWIEMGLKV